MKVNFLLIITFLIMSILNISNVKAQNYFQSPTGITGVGLTGTTGYLQGSFYFNGITNNGVNGSRLWFDGTNNLGHFDVRTSLSNSTTGLSFRVDNSFASTSRMFIASNGLIGLNTSSPSALLTVNGGDIKIIETNDYSEMSDGNSADLYLYDKTGSYLDLYVGQSHGKLSLGGSPTSTLDFSIGIWNQDFFKVYNSSPNVGLVTVGSPVVSTSPTGGYNFGVQGNAVINGSLVLGDPSTITATTKFPSGYGLYVTSGILAEKVKISLKTTSDWSDFVFAPQYKLRPLASVESYIKENKHLPDVPSAEEVVSNGVDVAKMDAILLQKIEELTLYIIELEKKISELQKK